MRRIKTIASRTRTSRQSHLAVAADSSPERDTSIRRKEPRPRSRLTIARCTVFPFLRVDSVSGSFRQFQEITSVQTDPGAKVPCFPRSRVNEAIRRASALRRPSTLPRAQLIETCGGARAAACSEAAMAGLLAALAS